MRRKFTAGELVSMQDVADAVGVSRAAVSLVLNNRAIRISDKKRQAILDEAKRLNYRPNLAALRLRRQKTQTLRLVFPGDPEALNELYMLELIRNLAGEAKRVGYDLLLELAESLDEDLTGMDPGRADGSIYLLDQHASPELARAIEATRQPFVTLGGSQMKKPPAYLVDFDVEEGTHKITRHLIELGHRQIAFLAGVVSPQKEQGFRKALAQARLRARPELMLLSGLKESGIADALVRLLDADPQPTAIVATNDTLAIRTIKTLLTMGRSVPKDLSVTGFDDIETARLISPGLTTLRIPLDQLATEAVHLLISQIDGQALKGPARIILPTRLVVRGSSKPRSL